MRFLTPTSLERIDNMFLFAINPFNCWNNLRAKDTIPSGNETAQREKTLDWSISSQATLKKADGSTTTKSTLNFFGMGKFARMGGFFTSVRCKVAYACIISIFFSFSAVEARVLTASHQLKILNPIVINNTVDMMNNFIGCKLPADVFFHDKPMSKNISSVGSGMIWSIDHFISCKSSCNALMKRVENLEVVNASNPANGSSGARKDFSDFPCCHIGISHFFDNVSGEFAFADSRNIVIRHPDKNSFFADTIFLSDFQSRFQLRIFSNEFFSGQNEFSKSMYFHGDILSPYDSISQEEKIRYSLDLIEKSREQDKEPVDNKMEIKAQGDKIKIPTLADVPIYTHNVGDTFEIDFLESPSITMEVNKAKRFHFGVETINFKQMKIKDWISRYSNQANFNMKKEIETEVFANIYADVHASNTGATAGVISANINLGATGSPITINSANVIRKVLDCQQVLFEQNVPNDDNWWMLIPAALATVFQDSDLKDASMTGDQKSILRNKGMIGQVGMFKMFTSNLLDIDTGTSNYHILFGHKSALWFVTQYTQVKLFEPQNAFVEAAVKGLNVYGYGVLQPAAIGQMVANVSLT